MYVQFVSYVCMYITYVLYVQENLSDAICPSPRMDIVIGSWRRLNIKVTEVVDQNTILLSYLSAAYEVTPEEACRDLSIIPSSNTESNQTAFSWPNDSGAFESSPPYHQIPTAKLDFTGVMRKVPENPVTFVRTCVKKNLRPYPLPKQKPLKTIHVSQAISMSKIVRLISSSCAVNWSLWD